MPVNHTNLSTQFVIAATPTATEFVDAGITFVVPGATSTCSPAQ